MNSHRFYLPILCAVALINACHAENIVITDPAKADADFAIQGEYIGEITKDDGKLKFGAQVIALGGGKFHIVVYRGGLPGDGWDSTTKKEEADGQTVDGVTTFANPSGIARIKDGVMSILNPAGAELGQFKHIIRESPTLGAKPPEGGLVLFDGSGVDQWQKGARMTEDKLLVQGPTTVKKFGNCTLHVEFRLPYMPYARGQGRGNSGVYMQSRYECQVLDSFGLAGKNNETGGIYEIKDPLLNMCFPPLSWQTYDIDYTAAKYEGGKKVKDAVMTVKLNGVIVQQDTPVPHATRSSPMPEGPDNAPVYLQDHGNPVRFRNVWIVEKP